MSKVSRNYQDAKKAYEQNDIELSKKAHNVETEEKEGLTIETHKKNEKHN